MENADLKKRILDEILKHLGQSQGEELRELLEEARKPKDPMPESNPPEESSEEKPQGISIEKVEVLKPKENFDDKANDAIREISKRPGSQSEPSEALMPGESEMSEDELEELLSKYLKQ